MSASEAAEWMINLFEAKRFLYQEEATSHLLHMHYEALAYFDHQEPARPASCLGRIASVPGQQQALPDARRMMGPEPPNFGAGASPIQT